MNAHLITTLLLAAVTSLAIPTVNAAVIGAITTCSPGDDSLTSIPQEQCEFINLTGETRVETSARANHLDGRLAVTSKRSGDSAAVPRVDARVSDTIDFIGGDPEGFRVDIHMPVYMRFVAGTPGPESVIYTGNLDMALESPDGIWDRSGSVAASPYFFDTGELQLLQIAVDYPEVVFDRTAEIPGQPEGTMLVDVSLALNWRPEFSPYYFYAGLTIDDIAATSQDLEIEMFTTGIEFIMPEGVRMVSESGSFLPIPDPSLDVPAPATILLLTGGLIGLIMRGARSSNGPV